MELEVRPRRYVCWLKVRCRNRLSADVPVAQLSGGDEQSIGGCSDKPLGCHSLPRAFVRSRTIRVPPIRDAGSNSAPMLLVSSKAMVAAVAAPQIERLVTSRFGLLDSVPEE